MKIVIDLESVMSVHESSGKLGNGRLRRRQRRRPAEIPGRPAPSDRFRTMFHLTRPTHCYLSLTCTEPMTNGAPLDDLVAFFWHRTPTATIGASEGLLRAAHPLIAGFSLKKGILSGRQLQLEPTTSTFMLVDLADQRTPRRK